MRTLNTIPAIVVPVLVGAGALTPLASKSSFRLHRSKLKPVPSPANPGTQTLPFELAIMYALS